MSGQLFCASNACFHYSTVSWILGKRSQTTIKVEVDSIPLDQVVDDWRGVSNAYSCTYCKRLVSNGVIASCNHLYCKVMCLIYFNNEYSKVNLKNCLMALREKTSACYEYITGGVCQGKINGDAEELSPILDHILGEIR